MIWELGQRQMWDTVYWKVFSIHCLCHRAGMEESVGNKEDIE